MRKLIPILLGLIALAGGAGAGWFLRPAPAADTHADAAVGHEEAPPAPAADGHAPAVPNDQAGGDHAPAAAAPSDGHGGGAAIGGNEYVKLNNQFIVPLIEGGRVGSMVIMSLSLEVKGGAKERVFAVEPKLRDTYLRVMFDHANAGGFAGTFTDRAKLDTLRATLAEVSRPLLGDTLIEVLIEDIVRQDNG